MLLCALPALAAERTVARITDLQGTASLEQGSESTSLRILARVREGNRIRLEAGGSLTLHFPGSHTDFRFRGPDNILVEATRAVSETSIAETKTHTDIGVSLDLADSDLGAISMRSITPGPPDLEALAPADTRVLLARPLQFRWRATTASGLFNLVLEDEAGHTVYQQTTAQTSLTLPPHIKLRPGSGYRWQVSSVAADGAANSATAAFSVAPSQVEARYYRMTGLKSGSLSDLVLYALYLDRMELHEEAREAWQYLETLRPGIQSQRGM